MVLPIKAVVLNLLSVGAAYGALVLIWQHGYGSHALWGIPATGVVVDFVPLMVFAFLFGLSMDYEVFILSRIKEAHDAGKSTDDAVVDGLGHTGRLVTSAAIILFLAFAALAAGPDVPDQGVRHRHGRRHPARRHRRARTARARPRLAAREVELVVAVGSLRWCRRGAFHQLWTRSRS